MGIHPNALLILELKPEDLSRKTMRAILEANDIDMDEIGDDHEIKIGGEGHYWLIMEDTYAGGWQIAAAEGSLVFFDFITYGYGESIPWAKLATQKEALEAWAKEMCERFNCSHEIRVAANYW